MRAVTKMRQAIALALLAVALAAGTHGAVAHDFWLQPNEFWVRPEATVPITLQVGHGPTRQRSPIRLSRIQRFEAFAPGGGASIDLRGDLALGGSTADGYIQLTTPGTYVLVLQTDNHAQSYQPAVKFNQYLQDEGLTPAVLERQRTHRMDADGTEIYSRITKSIVQVGEVGGQTDVTRALGLPLEIVLENNPYAEPRAKKLAARVFYEGQPVSGALVKLTHLEHDEAPLEMHQTDGDGRATFVMPTQGTWLLNVIWTKALPASQAADFETIFSSLSFGFP